ncbi:hypothetical protein PAXINDRAFT_20960 [Paxillus involutus ATCC 200175]|uniref:Uncharacterized protein n=1 Tax=Paxillus involutus ATCC 200175 TaxID=664439 RepID=A0A0C9TEX8_PAXIN|nr:hypothetical protein PAXINDRAFT_20960 [Paxillus involutus ATCC 200175]
MQLAKILDKDAEPRAPPPPPPTPPCVPSPIQDPRTPPRAPHPPRIPPGPCHSQRERHAPGENQHPVDQFKDVENPHTWKKMVEGSGSSQRQDPPGYFPDPTPPPPPPPGKSELDVEQLCREGGVNLTSFLLMKAISDAPDATKLPRE